MTGIPPLTGDSLAVLAAREALDEYDSTHDHFDMLTWEGRMVMHLRRLVDLVTNGPM